MSGTHDHGSAVTASRSLNRLLAFAVAPFLLATVVGLVLLWPTGETKRNEALGPPPVLYDGTVVERSVRPCLGSSGTDVSPVQCASVVVRLADGPERGQQVVVEVGEGPGAPKVGDDDPVVLGRTQDETGTVTYYFADFQRRTPLLLLGAIFALVVVLLGRWRGLAALAALAVSLLMIVKFVLPAILDGRNPLAVAIVGSAAIMFLALYLSHGVNAQTTTAVLGTLVSLALTGVLAAVFVAASRFTGLASEEAGFLQSAAGQINLRGLLLGGIVIGSLGVLDDVTVTQASAVWQLHAANNDLSVRRLYQAGLRIGRDHIASTV
ncbi:MAG TPA: YibE/F family protein, partial [Acidimicrobiales bacterium]